MYKCALYAHQLYIINQNPNFQRNLQFPIYKKTGRVHGKQKGHTILADFSTKL